jgi:hypothetical protein
MGFLPKVIGACIGPLPELQSNASDLLVTCSYLPSLRNGAVGTSRMDSFGNYPRQRPFDPFSVMLFKALQVVAFLFFLALRLMNPEASR